MTAPAPWRGDLIVGRGWARFIGRAGPAPSAACASTRVAVAMCSWIAVSAGDGVRPRRVHGVVAAPDTSLAVDPLRLYAQVLFLDARLEEAQRLGVRNQALDAAGRERAFGWRRAIYGLAPDDEIARVVHSLLVADPESAPQSAPENGADEAALREWDRVAHVAAACRGGATLASAVQASGFDTACECQATFRRLFGLTPASLLDSAELAGQAPVWSPHPGSSQAQ